jgi:hypothetical protein
MVVAGNTSPHAPPSLNLPTQSETPPKTLLGRLLLRGRPADEPENAEKVSLVCRPVVKQGSTISRASDTNRA